jgi:hypothetical protein
VVCCPWAVEVACHLGVGLVAVVHHSLHFLEEVVRHSLHFLEAEALLVAAVVAAVLEEVGHRILLRQVGEDLAVMEVHGRILEQLEERNVVEEPCHHQAGQVVVDQHCIVEELAVVDHIVVEGRVGVARRSFQVELVLRNFLEVVEPRSFLEAQARVVLVEPK